jgi:spore germination cell wall hydrolase CwlJ-like protein
MQVVSTRCTHPSHPSLLVEPVRQMQQGQIRLAVSCYFYNQTDQNCGIPDDEL